MKYMHIILLNDLYFYSNLFYIDFGIFPDSTFHNDWSQSRKLIILDENWFKCFYTGSKGQWNWSKLGDRLSLAMLKAVGLKPEKILKLSNIYYYR